MAVVSRLAVTPVKGLALLHPDKIYLSERGVAENRRFYLVDEDGRLYSGLDHGPLVRIVPDYDAESERLALRFPDGAVVEGAADELGEAVETDFYGRQVAGRIVIGRFAQAISAYAGKTLRLARTDRAGDGCDVHVLTLVSEESVQELARRAGREAVDGGRFRMLITIAGCRPHEEDAWNGRELGVGDAVIRVGGPVPRCATTTRDPSSGVRDLDTLRVIKEYRGLRGGKNVDFGVYGEVVEPGAVSVGDTIELAAASRAS